MSDVSDPSQALSPAERGARLGAAILDTFLAGVAYLPGFVGLIGLGVFSSAQTEQDALALAFLLPGVAVFLVWLYFTIVYVRRNGQTIGKKLLRIKVVRADGSPASLGRIFWLRNFVNGFLSLIPLYGIIDSLFIFSESRQCLHDKIADTIVVNA